MSDGDIILPGEDSPIDWQRYMLRLQFYPHLRLSRKEAIRFAESINEFVEPEDIQPGTAEWKIAGAAGMHVTVKKGEIALDAHGPSNKLEWYENRFNSILGVFEQRFSPSVALHCNVVISGLVELGKGSNAQVFLGGYVMMMHPYKLQPIERPLHVLGVRLMFPPYEESGGMGGADWSVDVRVESAFADETKLFLEADADWNTAQSWDDQFIETAVARLEQVSSFMSDRLIKFLRQPPFPEEREEFGNA